MESDQTKSFNIDLNLKSVRGTDSNKKILTGTLLENVNRYNSIVCDFMSPLILAFTNIFNPLPASSSLKEIMNKKI